MTDEILMVRRVSRDNDGSYIVACPHCQEVIGLEGEDLDELRGEQYQHRKRNILDGSGRRTIAIGCDGWLEVADDACYVRELRRTP